MKKILVLGFGILFFANAYAQPNCAQTLRLARSTYEQGRLHELEGLLEGCLKTGFSPTEKVEAYKFLTLAYIYLEEPEKADATMLALLQTDNEFQPSREVDPAEFIALWRTFRTKPVYRIGGKAGATVSNANVVTADNVDDGKSTYKSSFGFTAGVSAEIPVTILKMKNHLTFNPELYYQITKFTYTNSDDYRTNSGPRSQNWVSLPLSLQYSFGENDNLDRNKNKFNPYVGLGLQTSFLLLASTTGVSKITDNTGVEEKSYPVTADLNRLIFSGILSAGVKYKVGKGMLIAEVRYHYGLNAVTRLDGTYSNPSLTWDNHATDAIYKLNYGSLTVGYVINIYNPKKLTIKK